MNSKFVLHFKLITELSLGNNIKKETGKKSKHN